MKIIAQSSVPSRLSYHHLGYLAATSSAHSTLLGPGAFVIFVGCILLLRRIRDTGSWQSKLTFRRSGKRFWTGMTLVGIGVVIIVAGYEPGGRPLHPGGMTYSRAGQLAYEIKEHAMSGEAIPEDMHSLREAWQLDGSDTRDGWDREMRIRKETQDDKRLYLVVSAGADGRFDTEDDISCPREEERGTFLLPDEDS